MSNKVWLVVFLTLPSSALFAQKKEDFLALQRDMATMQDQMKELQKSQDEKMAALTTLLQQSMDAQARLGASLSQLQKNIDTSLADQQSKLVFPVAALGTKVDQMGQEFGAVKENVAALSSQLSKLDNKLADISSAVRTLGSAPVPPPPGPNAQASTSGPSAQTLWENANRDVMGNRDSVALDEYAEFLRSFPTSENAPTAQFNIGTIYDRGDMHQDALKAFNAVLDKYPENARTPDALYWKGMELMKMEQNADAAAVFRDFIKRYPLNENARKAQTNLHALAGAPANKKRK